MASCYIKHLANYTPNELPLLRILLVFTDPGYLKKIKGYNIFSYLGLNSVKSLKINLGSKGLSHQLFQSQVCFGLVS